MGTWSAGSFGNDAALDFVDGLNDSAGIAAAIRARGRDGDADSACEAIAACDLLAAMLGRPAPDMPEDALTRFAPFPAPDASLLAEARETVQHLRQGSELAALWAEAGGEDWQEALDDLLLRLDPAQDYRPPARAEAPLGPVLVHCFLCENSAPQAEAVDLVHEVDDGIIQYSATLHAHRACVEARFDPPHWNADGTPSAAVIARFARLLDGGDP